MKHIKGKISLIIYEGTDGYKVGVFRVKETNDVELKDYINKTINFTGIFSDLNKEDTYEFYGKLVDNQRYGIQFQVDSYKRHEIKGKEALIAFLSSSVVKGCGEKTATNIVDVLGEKALDKIKKDPQVLLSVPNMTVNRANKIYESIIKYEGTDGIILELKKYGINIKDALKMIKKEGNKTLEVFNVNPYIYKDVIDFNKLDEAYLKTDNVNEDIRRKACLLETFSLLEMSDGNTYFSLEELQDGLRRYFNIILNEDDLKEILVDDNIVIDNNRYFLKITYDNEDYVAERLLEINKRPLTIINDLFEVELNKLQKEVNVAYNNEQLAAIKKAIESRISIISGGPGTGKTTIIKAIVYLYKKIYQLKDTDIISKIALLAPTGRASKKLAEATGIGASTIHRFLKWNKEDNTFGINEFNPNIQKLIIIDETSMVDINLFTALLKGLTSNIQLVFVGDANQLPSVGPGLVLNDLIAAEVFSYTPLYEIYRQSSNSYIPLLAQEIKNRELDESFMDKKDDFNFLEINRNMIKDTIKKIINISIDKGLKDKDIQVLIPMYKGENGIDNINIILQELFNPPDVYKKELYIGDTIYREGDKVLELVNDPDKGVFNGDIGYIDSIVKTEHNKDVFVINFDGSLITFTREDMNQVKHAYAITIHKAQGSEFEHVIMPICSSYHKMLYNKLLYTGVSRAKKSLIIIGEINAFVMGINNSYVTYRHTDLENKIKNKVYV